MFQLARTKRELTVDFTNLTGFSGMGLRRLLQFCRYVRSSEITLKGVGASHEIRNLAQAAGFMELVRGAATEAAAISSTAPIRVDVYATHNISGYTLRPGSPLPFGASLVAGGINFSIFSRHALACSLMLFRPDAAEPMAEIPFPSDF